MASINASTTGAGGVITTADATGVLNIQSGGTTIASVTGSGVAVTGTGSFSGNVTLGNSLLVTPTGSAPLYLCRAWVYFNGTGTLSMLGNGNVSSVTDNGTGSYTINFTNAMPDANYSIVGTGNQPVVQAPNIATNLKTTTEASIATRNISNIFTDSSYVHAIVIR